MLSVTTIDGRRCTPVSKNNINIQAQATRTTTVGSEASTVSISASTITSSNTEEAVSISASANIVDALPALPSVQETLPSTQVTLTSTTSIVASQHAISSTASTPSVAETSAPLETNGPPVAASTLASLMSAALQTSTVDTSLIQTTAGESSPILTQSNGVPGSTTSKVADVNMPAPTETQTNPLAGAGQSEPASGDRKISGNGMSTQMVAAVAGGVIGALVALSLIAFLLWSYRKRLAKKRRSALLTPLSTENAGARGKKGSYDISRNSLGPTTIHGKLRAVAAYKYQRLRGRVNDPGEGDEKNGRPNNSTYTTSMPYRAQTRQQQQAMGGGAAGGGNGRRSQSLGNGPFLGGLGLDFDTGDPFADSNAILSHGSAKITPLAGSEWKNPFSDVNAISEPARVSMIGNASNSSRNRGTGVLATYIQNIRHSRGHSVSAANSNLRPPSIPSVYRESSVSVGTSDTRRTKFRSDPFDLDRPELLAQPRGDDSTARSSYSPPRLDMPNMPHPAHARAESFTCSRSSSASMNDWGDPGPDVGPAAGRRWNASP
ncbi:hypothetical protein F5Y17DRAFT_345393 [Xylariaceae sp. FL0594]|nr:hypothetical protein F5Y17DRAFT_345393 [Xylariaceae sp. FL0594]